MEGGGFCNLQFLVSLPYRCYMPNLVKNGPVLLEKLLTDDDERQNTAIGHLSDSCNLKTLQIYKQYVFIRGELICHFCWIFDINKWFFEILVDWYYVILRHITPATFISVFNTKNLTDFPKWKMIYWSQIWVLNIKKKWFSGINNSFFWYKKIFTFWYQTIGYLKSKILFLETRKAKKLFIKKLNVWC